MIQKSLVVGAFQCNCTLLACEKTKEAVLIDPGDEPEKILALIAAQGIKVKYLLHTHAHSPRKHQSDFRQAVVRLE